MDCAGQDVPGRLLELAGLGGRRGGVVDLLPRGRRHLGARRPQDLPHPAALAGGESAALGEDDHRIDHKLAARHLRLFPSLLRLPQHRRHALRHSLGRHLLHALHGRLDGRVGGRGGPVLRPRRDEPGRRRRQHGLLPGLDLPRLAVRVRPGRGVRGVRGEPQGGGGQLRQLLVRHPHPLLRLHHGGSLSSRGGTTMKESLYIFNFKGLTPPPPTVLRASFSPGQAVQKSGCLPTMCTYT
mmetsp:Transcript_51474/g.117132  ORF Transcript_51474/g.117132 Transcript_51474/m.117132 type:complete len:240 (+) Transcript_51474:618-1337(+)